ncbi:MAG TPA: hypothetical protein DCE41_34410 [Cytophagales bacterium]|nr:hypothetical protein [Cytophagales bacterium]HAA24165.1 hypothetical protein [Cytophagales bacterium]HAP63216.1 hypothetical protein [Cytophagales bacterium]
MLTFNNTLTIILVLLFLVLTFSTLTSQLIERFFGSWLRQRFLDREMERLIGPQIWKTGLRKKFQIPKPQLKGKIAQWYYSCFEHPKLTEVPSDEFTNELISWVKSRGSGNGLEQFQNGLKVLHGNGTDEEEKPETQNEASRDQANDSIGMVEKKRLAQKISTITLGATDINEIKAAIKKWFEDFGGISKKRFRYDIGLRTALLLAAIVVTIAFDLNLGRVYRYLTKNQAQIEKLRQFIDKTTVIEDKNDETMADLNELWETINDENWELPIYRPRALPQLKKDTTITTEFKIVPPGFLSGDSSPRLWRNTVPEWIWNSISITEIKFDQNELNDTTFGKSWPFEIGYNISQTQNANELVDYFKQRVYDTITLAPALFNEGELHLSLPKTHTEPPSIINRIVGYHTPNPKWLVSSSELSSSIKIPGEWPYSPDERLEISWDGDSTQFNWDFNPKIDDVINVNYTITGGANRNVSIEAEVEYYPPEKEKYDYLKWYELEEILGYLITILALALGGPFWFDVWRQLSGTIRQFRQPNKP